MTAVMSNNDAGNCHNDRSVPYNKSEPYILDSAPYGISSGLFREAGQCTK